MIRVGVVGWAGVLLAVHAAVAVVGSPPGEAGRAEALPPPTVLRLPFSIESAVVVGGAEQLRGTEVGEATWRALIDAGLVGLDTLEAWDALARSLKLGPQAAFDRLLGRSATIVARGLGADRRAEWVLICEVADDTQRRLRESLRPAARSVGDASTALTVEGGRIELALGASAPRGAGVRTAPLILAPVASRPLFDEVRASLVSGGIPGEPLAGGEAPHVTGIWSHPPTSAWAEVRAVPTATGWSLVSRSYPHTIADADRSWTESAVRAWANLDDDAPALAWQSTAGGPDLPIPRHLRPLADDLLGALRFPPELADDLSTHRALRVARRDSSVSVSLLLRSAGGAGFASRLEEWVCALLDVEGAGALSPDEQAAGLARLSDRPGSAAERLFGAGHALRWFTFSSRDGSEWALVDARPFRGDAADRDGAMLRRRAERVALAQEDGAPRRRLVAAGQARPWELVQAIGVRDGPLVALRWIARVGVMVPASAAVPGPASVEAQWTIDLDLARLSPDSR